MSGSSNIATITANFPEYDDLLKMFMVNLGLKKDEIYIAGGAIRDALLGRQPKDVDMFITTEKIYSSLDIVEKLTGIDDLKILTYDNTIARHDYSNVDILFKNTKIQIINRYVNYSLQNLILEFDYDICQYGYYQGGDVVYTTEGAKVLMSMLQIMELSPNDFLDPNKWPELEFVRVNNVERNLKRGIIFEHRYKVKLNKETFKTLIKLNDT